MGNKELFLILSIFIFCIFLIGFVSSVEMITSSAGVQYGDSILKEFEKAKINQSINDNETNQTFVHVLIDLKDGSEADALISSFSEEEFKIVSYYNGSSSVGVLITKEAFNKLINDSRVEKVYYEVSIHAFDREKLLQDYIYTSNTLYCFNRFGNC